MVFDSCKTLHTLYNLLAAQSPARANGLRRRRRWSGLLIDRAVTLHGILTRGTDVRDRLFRIHG
jgi:hypothetical protein